jgi:hypothetical protein
MTNTTKTAKNTEIRPCRCSIYSAVIEEVQDEDGNMVDIVEDTTGCTQTTKNEFAQGHDAKLKSHLIKWGVLGYEVARVEGGMRISNDAASQAAEYGFAQMVRDGIAKGKAKAEAARERADRKHEAQAAKAAKKGKKAPKVSLAKAPVDKLADAKITVTHAPVPTEEPLPVPVKATAKVGRWTYQGTVNVDNTFTYNAKLGGTKTAPAGTFTVLDA